MSKKTRTMTSRRSATHAVLGLTTLGLFLALNVNAWCPPSSASQGWSRRNASNRLTSASAALSMSSSAAPITLDGDTIRGPITPLGNFVLVRTKDTLMATEGGILLPDQSKERPTEGEVLAAGPGKLHPHTGVRIHNPVSTGMSVLYGKFDGIDMTYNDERTTMIRDDDVMLYYTGTMMTEDNVVPCRDYVLIKLDDDDAQQTSSGIVVAKTATKDYNTCEGDVVKIGEGRMCSTGDFTPSPVKVGDRAKFKDYAGNEVKIQGEEYALVRMVDILCAIDEGALVEQ